MPHLPMKDARANRYPTAIAQGSPARRQQDDGIANRTAELRRDVQSHLHFLADRRIGGVDNSRLRRSRRDKKPRLGTPRLPRRLCLSAAPTVPTPSAPAWRIFPPARPRVLPSPDVGFPVSPGPQFAARGVKNQWRNLPACDPAVCRKLEAYATQEYYRQQGGAASPSPT